MSYLHPGSISSKRMSMLKDQLSRLVMNELPQDCLKAISLYYETYNFFLTPKVSNV